PNGTAPRLERRRAAKAAFDLIAGRRVLQDAARLVAVANAETRQLQSLGVDAARIRLIPNPVDLDEFADPPARGRLRARANLGGPPVLLYLGTLPPRKRLAVLARAFARLARPDAALVIAGNDMGSGRATRGLVRELGIDPQTVFTGLLRGRDRLEALADATVVAYS